MDFAERTVDKKHASNSGAHSIAPEILAVITAAATAMLGANLRIASVELVQAQYSSASSWTRQGRSSIQASHNPRTQRQTRGAAGK